MELKGLENVESSWNEIGEQMDPQKLQEKS